MRANNPFRTVLAGAILVSTSLFGTAATAAQTVTPAMIADLRQVGDPQISPDGETIAYVVATPKAAKGPPTPRIWRIAGNGGEAHELSAPAEAGDRDPRWSADGTQLLFLSDRKPGAADDDEPLAGTQVWQVAADGDTPRRLTRSPGEVIHFALSPDATRLAFIAVDAPSPAHKARIEAGDDAVHVDHPEQFARLWMQDLRSGGTQVLTPPGLQVHDVAWAPNGERLALRVSDGTTLNDYWYDSRVVLASPDGEIGATLEDHASAHPLAFSPDGARLLAGELAAYGMVATIHVHDLARNSRQALASDWPGTLWLARWQDGDTIIGQGQRGVRGALLEIDPRTGKARESARPQIPYQSFTVARDGRITYLGIADHVPAEVWTATIDGELRQLTTTNPQVADWSLGRVEELRWPASADGREITGVLVTPPGYDGTTALPTLVQIHGGPAWAWWSGWLGSWHDWAQLLASHGYAVFLPNPRGSEGQGAAFTELNRGDWGGGDLQDVLDGLGRLETRGIVDPERVAIGGWSYGGYLSAWAATQSDRFATAIVGAGISDIGAMALTTDVPDYLPGYFGDPIEQRDAYDAHSPIRHIAAVDIPVLILHGEADARVPISQGEMLYRALRFHGTPVEMIRYPRAPHWFHEREHGRDVQQRVLDWLDARLRHGALPAGAGATR